MAALGVQIEKVGVEVRLTLSEGSVACFSFAVGGQVNY